MVDRTGTITNSQALPCAGKTWNAVTRAGDVGVACALPCFVFKASLEHCTQGLCEITLASRNEQTGLLRFDTLSHNTQMLSIVFRLSPGFSSHELCRCVAQEQQAPASSLGVWPAKPSRFVSVTP